MAKYNTAIEVTFNDNDGGVGWRVDPSSASDIARYQKIFGKWRARWIFFKRFWMALRWMEDYAEKYHGKPKRIWILKAEIPE